MADWAWRMDGSAGGDHDHLHSLIFFRQYGLQYRVSLFFDWPTFDELSHYSFRLLYLLFFLGRIIWLKREKKKLVWILKQVCTRETEWRHCRHCSCSFLNDPTGYKYHFSSSKRKSIHDQIVMHTSTSPLKLILFKVFLPMTEPRMHYPT